MVGLYPDYTNLKIKHLSVSQKQRIALARALILQPEVIIIDDALGTLDASVRVQLLNLILDLQEHLGISYIYVGQHLGIIKHIADQVLVMDEGEIIESGTPKEIFTNPQNNITRLLVEVILVNYSIKCLANNHFLSIFKYKLDIDISKNIFKIDRSFHSF